MTDTDTLFTMREQDARSWVSDLEEWVWENSDHQYGDTDYFSGNILETLGAVGPDYEHLAPYTSWTFEFFADWQPECHKSRCRECPPELNGKLIIYTHHGEHYTYHITPYGLEF